MKWVLLYLFLATSSHALDQFFKRIRLKRIEKQELCYRHIYWQMLEIFFSYFFLFLSMYENSKALSECEFHLFLTAKQLLLTILCNEI